MAKVDLKNCTLTIKDGGSNSVEVKIGEGNLQWTDRRNIEYSLNRGSLTGATIREGDEVPVEVRFDATYEYISSPSAISSDAPVSIDDALKGTNACSSWVSSDTDTCQPYAVDLEFVNDPGECGDAETITFPDFRWEQIDHDVRAGTIAISGKCNTTPEVLSEAVTRA